MRFHDSKLKLVKALLFRSFHETEASTAGFCSAFICGRAYTLVKLRCRNGQHYSGILKVSSIARWKGGQGMIFLIDLESIQHKLSSHYSLTIYFSRRFPYIDGPSFSPYQPLQNVDFSKVGNM